MTTTPSRRSGQDPNELIREAAEGRLTEEELGRVIEHVAEAGFDPDARERARGRLRGFVWRGDRLKSNDMLPPAERHYISHVRIDQEWPASTSLDDYIESVRRVIRDPTSGVFANRYLEEPSLAFIRESRGLKGPGGHDWVLIQYRTSTGHWTTAFQPVRGCEELDRPEWSDIRWLRVPKTEREFGST